MYLCDVFMTHPQCHCELLGEMRLRKNYYMCSHGPLQHAVLYSRDVQLIYTAITHTFNRYTHLHKQQVIKQLLKHQYTITVVVQYALCGLLVVQL